MSVLPKFSRKRPAPVDEAETVARYRHLLRTLPPEVSVGTLEAQFRALPAFRRKEIFEQLQPWATAEERDATPEPVLLARLMLRAETGRDDIDAPPGLLPRDRLDPSAANWDGRMEAMVARHFMGGTMIIAFFANADPAATADQPEWVSEMFGPGAYDSAPADGVDAVAGYNAGGYDLGGFDGGGVDGGGFDGGGGFGGDGAGGT